MAIEHVRIYRCIGRGHGGITRRYHVVAQDASEARDIAFALAHEHGDTQTTFNLLDCHITNTIPRPDKLYVGYHRVDR